MHAQKWGWAGAEPSVLGFLVLARFALGSDLRGLSLKGFKFFIVELLWGFYPRKLLWVCETPVAVMRGFFGHAAQTPVHEFVFYAAGVQIFTFFRPINIRVHSLKPFMPSELVHIPSFLRIRNPTAFDKIFQIFIADFVRQLRPFLELHNLVHDQHVVILVLLPGRVSVEHFKNCGSQGPDIRAPSIDLALDHFRTHPVNGSY